MTTNLKALYTNAPTAYDFGYTIEVRHVGTDPNKSLPHGGHQPVRKVAVPADSVEYQKGRYLSGMYFVCESWDECLKLANAGGFTRFSMDEQRAEDSRRSDLRWEGVRRHGVEQQMALVKLSPRKYAVVMFTSTANTSASRFGDKAGQYFTIPEGEVVFAGKYDDCRKEFESRVEALPPHLLDLTHL